MAMYWSPQSIWRSPMRPEPISPARFCCRRVRSPLILSQVPVHYTTSLANDGFARRLVVTSGGQIACEYTDAEGKTTTGAYDLVSVLEAFLAQHPDFSYRGALAVLGISGDPGPLGYDITGRDRAGFCQKGSPEPTEHRLRICQLHLTTASAMARHPEEEVAQDVKQWKEALEPVLGPVSILFYANGADLPIMKAPNSRPSMRGGIRYFCALDSSVNSWVQIENTYIRQSRRTINGTRITEEAGQVADLFDAAKVISPDRPK